MKVLWDYHANKEVSLKIQAQRIQIHTFYSLHFTEMFSKFSFP